MVITCCVYKCNNRQVSENRTRSFHRFPNCDKSPSLYRQWLHKIQRADFVPTKYTYVCSDHFVEDDFEIRNTLKVQLLPNTKSKPCLKITAVPSVNLTGPTDNNTSRNKRRKSQFLTAKEKRKRS